MADARIEKWTRWLEESIKPEVLGIYSHRHVYRVVGEVTQSRGGLPPSPFFDYLASWYVHSQALAIRRQAERSERVLSLGRLVSEIADDPERITKEWFLRDAPDEHLRRQMEEGWNRLFGGDTSDHVDPACAQRDLAALSEAAETVKNYVDKHVAHVDQNPLHELPTFGDLNRAIDAIGDTFRRYSLLLTQGSWLTLVSTFQVDWLAPFREPWLLPEHEVQVQEFVNKEWREA